MVTTSSHWGRGSLLRNPDQPDLCGVGSIPGVWGQSPGGGPRCGSQASYRGGAAGGVLAAFPVVPASSRHSLLASASGRPCRSWFLPQADPAAQLHLQDSAKGLGSHPCPPVSLPHPSSSQVAQLPWNLQWLFPSVFRLDCTSLGGCVYVYVCVPWPSGWRQSDVPYV